jgi:head-tail adaptor
VTLRYRAGVQPDMRFRKGVRLFLIVTVVNSDERNRWLTCQCEEREL